jgi:hypothetical protein
MAGSFSDRAGVVGLLAHELGHNLGLAHAATRRFDGEALGPMDTEGTIDEYGDALSSMSSWSTGHYAAPHKMTLGWAVDGANAAVVETSGTFTLTPYESAPSGLQVLKVRRGTGNDAWLYVAYRQPIGSDAKLAMQPFGGVVVHYQDAYTGGQSQLLDMSPATPTFADSPLDSGLTWTDPYSNVSLTVGSASANGLDVTVAYSAAPCVPAAPTVSLDPPSQTIVAGTSASYTVTVTNNDSSSCKSSAFALGASAGALVASLSQTSVTLAPKSSASAVLTVSASSSTGAGTFGVSASASAGLPASAGASCGVTPPAHALSATLVVPGSVARGGTASISVGVLMGGAPATGAAVQLTIAKPNGTTSSASVTTDASGKAVYSYKVAMKDPRGTYTVSATASSSGLTATPPAATFTVQ